MKKYQQILKLLFDNRLNEDGYMSTGEIKRRLNFKWYWVRKSLKVFNVGRKVECIPPKKPVGRGNAFKWRITEAGVEYLYYKNIISKDEYEKGIKDLKLRESMVA